MNELNRMTKQIVKYTVFISCIFSILGFILFENFKVFLGVWLGCFIGIMGFLMIRKFAQNLTDNEEAAKKQGMSNYMIRYGFYSVAFLAFTLLGIPVLAILAGFLSSKVAIVVYALKERED